MIAVLAELGIEAERVQGRSGVWLRATDEHPGDKIGAIGIRVAEGVTMHGFALNCSNSFDAYDAIIACGIKDAGVTSISRELGRTVTPTDIIQLVSEQLAWFLEFDNAGVDA
jgi:lipoyl(octanoyl) transferase